jgi:hypothetical protein
MYEMSQFVLGGMAKGHELIQQQSMQIFYIIGTIDMNPCQCAQRKGNIKTCKFSIAKDYDLLSFQSLYNFWMLLLTIMMRTYH